LTAQVNCHPHPFFSFTRAEFIFKRVTALHQFSYVADMPQPWQCSMALPLTFTASFKTGLSRSRVKRRLNRYRRSSDGGRSGTNGHFFQMQAQLSMIHLKFVFILVVPVSEAIEN
jgi:hypothetical protein